MATSFDELIRELRAFRNRREIVNATARGIRKAVVPARKAIREKARSSMPKSGGLNVWLSKLTISAQVRLSGNKAGVKLKGGRNSKGGRTDVDAIDRGRVRAPSWGRKFSGQWHTQSVPRGFFKETAADLPDWRENVDREIDQALDTLRRG